MRACTGETARHLNAIVESLAAARCGDQQSKECGTSRIFDGLSRGCRSEAKNSTEKKDDKKQ
jgi:hypothetical protein